MTLRELNRLCGQNNIPDTVKLRSDSGWECDATDMSLDGVYYHEGKNELVITQGSKYDSYRTDYDWVKLEMKVKYEED